MSAVTVLGLGTMGAALAKALRKAGNEVVVWNRTAGRAVELNELAIRKCHSAAEAVLASDVAGTLPEMAHQIDTRRFADNVGSNLAMQAAGMATIVEASQAAGVDAGLMLVVQRWLRAAVEAGHGGEGLGRLVDVIHQRFDRLGLPQSS